MYKVYNKWKKYNESFSYNFRNDCVLLRNVIDGDNIRFDDVFNVLNGQHPRLLRLLLQKKTSIQTIVVLNEILSFNKNWDKEIAEKVVWPKISSTITKLKGFMRYNKTECKLIMKEVFNG